MTPEENKLLQKIAILTEENNDILRRIQRARRWEMASRILYWILIIGVSFGAYYAIQPYLEMMNGFGGLSEKVSGGMNRVDQLRDMLNEI